MNRHKLNGIVEFVRARGVMADPLGRDIDMDSVLTAYGLNELLTRHEQILVKHELTQIYDAQRFIAQLELSQQKH